MNLDGMTIGQIKILADLLAAANTIPAEPDYQEDDLHPFEIGENYIIRTVTHITVGTVTDVGKQELVLVNAAWIAETGRWADTIKSGVLSEVEPYPDEQEVIVGRGAIVDATKWLAPLPRVQK